jgi:hypothetical protein
MAVTFTSITNHHLIAKGARIVYEPSVYNGNGAEIRKNLVLAVDQTIRDQLTAIETQLHLGPTLCFVVKSKTIRVKIDTDQVRLFDADHHQINPPEKWVHSNVEVRLEVRGTWRTATNAGISVCFTDIRFAEDTSVSPFR